MRNITDVIDMIASVVPDGNDSLIERLMALKMSASLAAPEMQPEWWNRLHETLAVEIGEIDEDWKERVRMIFSADDDDSVVFYGVSAVSKAAPLIARIMAAERYIEERGRKGVSDDLIHHSDGHGTY